MASVLFILRLCFAHVSVSLSCRVVLLPLCFCACLLVVLVCGLKSPLSRYSNGFLLVLVRFSISASPLFSLCRPVSHLRIDYAVPPPLCFHLLAPSVSVLLLSPLAPDILNILCLRLLLARAPVHPPVRCG